MGRLLMVTLACMSLQAQNIAAPALRCAIERAITDAIVPPGFAANPVNDDGQTTQPPAKPPEPSLGDLGFPKAATQPNPQEQARLDKRAHMLRMHQRLGLITIAPLVATVISGGFAGGHQEQSTMRDLHAALGSVSGGLYFSTAYYAIFAPRIAEHLQRRWAEGCRNATKLFQEVRELGYRGGRSMVAQFVSGWRKSGKPARPHLAHRIAPKHAAILVMRTLENLSSSQQLLLEACRRLSRCQPHSPNESRFP